MKVYIITECNSKVGYGHFSRCISLYHAFKERNIEPIFIIDGDENIKDAVDTEKIYLFNWVKKNRKLYELIDGADLAIFDSYSFNESIACKISEIVKFPVFIDDNNRINYPKGVVINSSAHAKYLNYPINSKIYYLLGPEYSMLKKIFWDTPDKILKEQIETIMITLGTTDNYNLTPKLIDFLDEKVSSIKKKVIIGKYFKNIEEIRNMKKKKCELIYFPDAERMKKIMLKADVAITAGGQTSYELASLSVPSIIITVVDHQVQSAEKLAKMGIAFYAGWCENRDLLNKILEFIHQLKNLEIRKKMINLSKKSIKPYGSREIIDVLIKKMN